MRINYYYYSVAVLVHVVVSLAISFLSITPGIFYRLLTNEIGRKRIVVVVQVVVDKNKTNFHSLPSLRNFSCLSFRNTTQTLCSFRRKSASSLAGVHSGVAQRVQGQIVMLVQGLLPQTLHMLRRAYSAFSVDRNYYLLVTFLSYVFFFITFITSFIRQNVSLKREFNFICLLCSYITGQNNKIDNITHR